MSEAKKDYPAFPLPDGANGSFDKDGIDGLSKREYIAIAAMQAFLSNPESCANNADLARYSFRMADAMIEASGGRS